MIRETCPPETVSIFREAMSWLPTGVFIVTTDGKAGRCGITVSSFAPITDNPPTISFCVARKSYAHDILKENINVSLNLINEDQSDIALRFSKKPESNNLINFFDAEIWQDFPNCAPILSGAIFAFSGSIVSFTEIGTHSMFICSINRIRIMNETNPSLYFRRKFINIDF